MNKQSFYKDLFSKLLESTKQNNIVWNEQSKSAIFTYLKYKNDLEVRLYIQKGPNGHAVSLLEGPLNKVLESAVFTTAESDKEIFKLIKQLEDYISTLKEENKYNDLKDLLTHIP